MKNPVAGVLGCMFVLALVPLALAADPPQVKLWEKTPDVIAGKDTDGDPTEPTIEAFLPAKEKANGAAVVILPGGGYGGLATGYEGREVAKFLNTQNVAAFVVRYRHAPRYRYPVPVLDAQRGIRTVRAKAVEFAVDPARIGVLGFSAGGHLASVVATQFDKGRPDAPDAIDRVSSRPDFAILAYPVIALSDETLVHKGSRENLTGGKQELWAALSSEKHVTRETPPTFIVHTANDTVVPVGNSLLFFAACQKMSVPVEMHIFARGPHGFGLGGKARVPGDVTLSAWPELLIHWMDASHFMGRKP